MTTDPVTAMDRWVAEFATRDELAAEYARLLHEWPATAAGWSVLNIAIIDRWTPAALIYIKQRAWELAQDVV